MLKLVSPDQKLAIYREIAKDGAITRQGLAEKFGVDKSSIDRYLRAYRKRGSLTLQQLAKAKLNTLLNNSNPTGAKVGRRKVQGKYVHLYPEMREAREEGMTINAIAEKFGTSKGVVTYALYSNKANTVKGGSNGSHENGYNRNILIGVAYAETERFIANLASRLALAPAFLRSRLHELLGREEIRGTRRPED